MAPRRRLRQAYTSQIVALLMFALLISNNRVSMRKRRQAIMQAMGQLPRHVEQVPARGYYYFGDFGGWGFAPPPSRAGVGPTGYPPRRGGFPLSWILPPRVLKILWCPLIAPRVALFRGDL